jgi:hypothetical protein
MNETTENFLKVMAEFKWPESKPVFYRLYYNDDGSPQCYSMEELPGKYVEVDREAYIRHAWNIKVIDQIIHTIPQSVVVQKLQPCETQGTACDPKDVCVIVDTDKPHVKWNLKYNEVN